MKLRPLNDRIVIKRVDEETKSRGGIIIPDTAKEKPISNRLKEMNNYDRKNNQIR
jgi:chaperonin GroES